MIEPLLRSQLREERRRLGILIALSLIGAVLAVLQADLLAQIIERVFLRRMKLGDNGMLIADVLLVMVLRSLHGWCVQRSGLALASAIKRRLRHLLCARLLAAGPWPARERAAGDWSVLLQNGIDNLEPYFSRFLPQLATAALVPLCILLRVAPLDATSFWLLLVTAPLIPLFMSLIGRRAEAAAARQWNSLTRLGAHFFDVLQGLFILKLFERSREQAAVIARISARFRASSLEVLRVAFLSALVLELCATISTAIVAVTVGLRLLYGWLDFYQALFVLLLTPEFYLPLRLLGAQFHAGLAGKTAAADLAACLERLPERAWQGQQRPAFDAIGIQFCAVRYSYDDGKTEALQGLDLTMAAGATTAVVGASGSGKSTLAGLLLGFDCPQGGRVLINGLDMAELNLQHWLEQVAYVPQNPFLLNASLADNVCLTKPAASRADVERAVAAAGLAEWAGTLPNGYDERIGEGGRSVSGGEARRIAIARAFLQDAKLLILDEATAGLDSRQEQLINESLARLMRGRTVLVLAHRLNTVVQADRIFVLEEGRVAEHGNHEALVAIDGKYAALLRAFRGTTCDIGN